MFVWIEDFMKIEDFKTLLVQTFYQTTNIHPKKYIYYC